MAAPNREELLLMLRKRLSPRRVLHTLGVEAVAVCLAARWEADAEAAGIAALLHDMTKEASNQLILMRDYGILPAERDNTVPSVYHALTGEALALKLGFRRDIAGAVRWHTTGRAGMTVLEKVIYLADKVEPLRPLYTGLPEIRGVMYTDLDSALTWTLSRIMRWNRERGAPVEQNSEEALRWLEGKCADEIL